MHPSTKLAESQLREFSALLGLPYEPQDWGIVNAAGDRLQEFIGHFERGQLSPTVRYELAELILASANDRLQQGESVDIEAILCLSRGDPAAFNDRIKYWATLPNTDEFPIGPQLRAALGWET